MFYKKLTILSCMLCVMIGSTYAQTVDKTNNISEQIIQLQAEIIKLNSEVKKLWVQRNKQMRQGDSLSEGLKGVSEEVKTATTKAETLNARFSGINNTLKSETERLNKTVSDVVKANNQVQIQLNTSSNQIAELKAVVETRPSNNTFSLYDVLIGFVLAIAIGAVYVFLKRLIQKNSESITEIKSNTLKSSALTDKTIESLDKNTNEVSELLKSYLLTKQVDPAHAKQEVDHSLIKALIDRMTFMQMTLYKMDASIRGHRQLSKSIRQMNDTLLANGYEVVDMLGKPYHEGMKVIVNFIDDDNLKAGEQIITGITKPQINYKGTMIQAAQITVSQNV